MGAAASNASLLRGLGLATSSPTGQDDNTSTQWNIHVKTENPSLTDDDLVLGFPSAGNGGFAGMMMGLSSPFGEQPMTRDLLGLNIGGTGGGTSRGGLSALLTSFGGRFDVADASTGRGSSPAEG